MTDTLLDLARAFGVVVDRCDGIFTSRSTGAVRDCSAAATHESLRTCHGQVKRSLACDRHAASLLAKDATQCGTCGTRTVLLVALVPLGGAA